MEKFVIISKEEAETLMPQASNLINFMNSGILNMLPEQLWRKVWIAGGSIRDWLSKKEVSTDYDLFLSNRKDMATLVYWLRNKYNFKHYLITKNAIKGSIELFGKKTDVDIVKKEFQSPIDTIDKFDFTVCCFATDGFNFFYHVSAPFDLLKKKLVIHSLPHPIDSFKRFYKYTNKGFKSCNGTIMTISKAIAELDPNNELQFEFYKFD